MVKTRSVFGSLVGPRSLPVKVHLAKKTAIKKNSTVSDREFDFSNYFVLIFEIKGGADPN
jgi:hypothetical protein